MNKRILAALGLMLIPIGTAFAQADPPARVGRLSDVEGTGSFHNGDQDQWSPATINYPVIAGQSYWTEPQTRLELEVGGAAFRLDETSLLSVYGLDDATTRLELDQGALNLHIASVPPGGVQVLTPLGWVSIGVPGAYHLDVGHPDGDRPAGFVVLTALYGSAEFDGPGSRVAVLAGESATIGGNPLTAQLSQATTTPIDDWANERERRAVADETRRYVSPQATGYQDLDGYGGWSQEASYGAVWYPRDVPADWQPYRYGHWAWLQPWGWTWVDDAPWGFAPFHYGRWVEVGGRWGWCPGERVERPVYAPALVAFIGGAGFAFAVGGAPEASIGWVPLAPDEVYYPTYHVSHDYVRSVNETSVSRTVINNIAVANGNNNVTLEHFHNQRAATVMPAAAFTGAAAVQRATLAVPHDELLHAHATADLQHLPPTLAARAGRATPVALTPGGAEAKPPTAPGPKIQPQEHRLSHLPPPPSPGAPGTPPAAALPHDHRDAHTPPAATPGNHPPAPSGSAPAATAPTKPEEHRDAHVPPPAGSSPAHPAATMNVPPPVAVTPPKPPSPPPAAAVTAPKPPTPPATAAPKPPQPAPANAPAHGGPPPKDKDKDKKDEPKPNG